MKLIDLLFVRSSEQLVDVLTHVVSTELFCKSLNMLSLIRRHLCPNLRGSVKVIVGICN